MTRVFSARRGGPTVSAADLTFRSGYTATVALLRDCAVSATIDEEAQDLALEPAPMKQSMPGRLGSLPTNYLKSWLGTPWDRRLSRAALIIPSIRRWEREYEKLNE